MQQLVLPPTATSALHNGASAVHIATYVACKAHGADGLAYSLILQLHLGLLLFYSNYLLIINGSGSACAQMSEGLIWLQTTHRESSTAELTKCIPANPPACGKCCPCGSQQPSSPGLGEPGKGPAGAPQGEAGLRRPSLLPGPLLLMACRSIKLHTTPEILGSSKCQASRKRDQR